VKIGNVPAPMVRMLSLLMRPFQPGLSQVMGWALHTDSHDASFDPTPTLAKYPIPMTSLPEFIQAQVTKYS
jgi:hypothetical protein